MSGLPNIVKLYIRLDTAVYRIEDAFKRQDPFNEGINDDLVDSYGKDASSQYVGEKLAEFALDDLKQVRDLLRTYAISVEKRGEKYHADKSV